MADSKNKIFLRVAKISGVAVLIFILSFGIFTVNRACAFSKITQAPELTEEQSEKIKNIAQNDFGEVYEILKDLPYKLQLPEIDLYAGSAILIDVASGEILYSKNADEVIPPASMTKLFAMYVVDEAVSEGKVSYDSVIPLPPETWACNMPPHSSLMFLGEGQTVTLEELLLGLSVCSGNDAAYALAYGIFGGMDALVQKMNAVALNLGLENTYFEESSGYSENNKTTAREMAEFARVYLLRHPDSLERYHSVESFTYPKEKNLAPGDVISSQDWSQGLTRHITMPITQKNTNPLLGKLDGCDGLKTGYIDESGYNLALTAQRDGRRFLSVTMKGPGANSTEGQNGRVHDGTNLMEWAFSSFGDFKCDEMSEKYFVKCYGAKEKALNLVTSRSFEELNKALCGELNNFAVPYVEGDSIEENLKNVKVQLSVPSYIFGEVTAGEKYGEIQISLGNYILVKEPLFADRSIEKSGFFTGLADKLIRK